MKSRVYGHASREGCTGWRGWLHVGQRACVKVEVYWWSPRFGVTLGTDEDGWNLSLQLPPFAVYLSLDGFGLWQPMRTCIATWDGNRPFTIPDRRECECYVADWSIRFAPWGRWGEWRSADPWWIRGVSLDLRRLVLGERVYQAEELALVPCHVPMPEGNYPAVAKVQRVTRGYTRWFKRVGVEVDLSIPKGIPFAGKGENSWDCGDDGLFGLGGNSIDDAIKRAQESVNERRQRYGHASPEAVTAALS